MALVSPRLAPHARLQSAARNQPPLRKGETGQAVGVMQQAFIDLGFSMPVTTGNGAKPPDGIYGDETAKTVRTFQTQRQLSPDGIAGKDTLHALDALLLGKPLPLVESVDEHTCGNCFSMDDPLLRGQAHLVQSKFNLDTGHRGTTFRLTKEEVGAKAKGLLDDLAKSLGSKLGTVTAIQIPTSMTPLATWIAGASQALRQRITDTFGTSIDPSNVMVTNGLGASGRAFVLFVPRKFVVGGPALPRQQEGMLMVNWGDNPTDNTVIHELTHVWQSQHATTQSQYMVNAVKSQGLASDNGGSAYAWQDSPRRLFKEYAAEQIARQVECGVSIIITKIKGVTAWAIDADNDTSLATPRWEDPNRAGVRKV